MDPSPEPAATQNDNDDHDHLDTFVNDTLVNCDTTAQRLVGQQHAADRQMQGIQQACKTLYDRVRVLSQLYEQHVGTSCASTMMLPELLLMDAETVWGQVELQNEALRKVLERSCKRLAKEDNVQVLAVLDSEDEKEGDDSGEEGESEDDVSDDDEGEGSKDEQRRIEARMQRAMQDMDDDDAESDEEDDSDDGSRKETASNVDPEEFKRDEEAVNLHDGFFNLQEMEAFADEEEEYLPTQTLDIAPKERPKKLDGRSFHQKQREGAMELEDDDGGESDTGSQDSASDAPIRRKYRKNKEIDALLSLYSEPKEGNKDSDDDNVIQMTAADLFGKPNPEYYKRWNSRQRETGKDDDSWNEYDFEKNDDEAGNTGWNSEDDGSEQDENENDEEVVEMKGAAPENPSRPPTKQAAAVLRQTEQLEKELLAEKPWQMKGESGASSRPVNSLLETTPEFEVNAKVAPAITVEFTENLEEMIQKRILAEDWDDVVPRELPDVGWNMKRGEAPEVSQEKSKLSLGELYEREYLKKAIGYDKDAVEKETEEEKVKNEMRTLFANLCSKLDALSNYHFAPRPVADEADVRQVSKPAIAMEEVLPLHVSDARASAPEEVFGAKRGRDAILRDDTELEQTDRKRLRSAKKAARRKARKAKEADEKLISRLQPGNGLSNPYEKRKMREELSMARAGGKVTTGTIDTNDYGDSATFFKRMQHEAKESISKGKAGLLGDESKKKGSRKGESSKLML